MRVQMINNEPYFDRQDDSNWERLTERDYKLWFVPGELTKALVDLQYPWEIAHFGINGLYMFKTERDL